MSATLGAISSYTTSVQNMQLSLIKQNIETQKQAVDILLGSDNNRMVAISDSKGTQIDIEV